MPFHQEATFHDRKSIGSTVLQQTSSTEFVDVSGATFTAKDLGTPGDYLGWLSVLISSSLNNTTASFRLLLNGNVTSGVSTISLRVKDIDIGFTLMSDLGGMGIVKNDVLQLQFATDIGTLSLVEFSILVDGVPAARVV